MSLVECINARLTAVVGTAERRAGSMRITCTVSEQPTDDSQLNKINTMVVIQADIVADTLDDMAPIFDEIAAAIPSEAEARAEVPAIIRYQPSVWGLVAEPPEGGFHSQARALQINVWKRR